MQMYMVQTFVVSFEGQMSEKERHRRLVEARSKLSRIMFDLLKVKEHSSLSEWKQIAEIIVELGRVRDKIQKIETRDD